MRRWCLSVLLCCLLIGTFDVASQVFYDAARCSLIAEPAGDAAAVTCSTFLELAKERFEVRNGRPATVEEETWAFGELQLIRVPKAGSSEASLIARRLGGCTPRGPCCRYPGDPPGSCPEEGLMCPRDYEACFTEMTQASPFQNIAARMFSGHNAYEGRAKLCLDMQQDPGGGGDCAEDLRSVLDGVCKLNLVMMCEAWESSILLLFETLPWLGPSSDLFLIPKPEHSTAKLGVQIAPPSGSRHNTGAKYEEGMKHITPDLRDAASRANQVDEVLHKFVSAKFCDRLREVGLLNHPLVAGELATNELLDQRCNDDTWAMDTLKRYDPLAPASCRLYRPFAKPQMS